jgi:hypothetical protein
VHAPSSVASVPPPVQTPSVQLRRPPAALRGVERGVRRPHWKERNHTRRVARSLLDGVVDDSIQSVHVQQLVCVMLDYVLACED